MAFNGGSAGVLRANLGIIIGTRSVEQGPTTFAGINMGLILVVVHKLHWPVYWNSEEKLGKKEQYSSPLKSALGGLQPPDGLITRPLSPSCGAHTPCAHVLAVVHHVYMYVHVCMYDTQFWRQSHKV